MKYLNIKKFVFLLLMGIITISNLSAQVTQDNSTSIQDIKDYCVRIQKEFDRYKWGDSKCSETTWESYRKSKMGHPLMFTSFGDQANLKNPNDVTILMCGVHGDEITPVRFCMEAINYVAAEFAKKEGNPFKNKFIIISPIVSPDSFFLEHPTRTNANGVDVNRNFPTKDFYAQALRLWVNKYRRDKRRFPGKSSMSEAEVIFQVNLIKRFKPGKIISVHSPLTLLDYDGPGSSNNDLKNKMLSDISESSKDLLIKMSKSAKDYRIQNYPYFPGSLGNWAGKERNIPTYTLELPSSDPAKAKEYWDLFANAIRDALADDLALKPIETVKY